MKHVAVAAFLLCLCVAAIGEETVVPLVDSSAPGSPLANVGTAALSEAVAGEWIQMHHTEQWAARNVSSKPIVAVVESVIVHYANGANSSGFYEHETFFFPQMVMPGQEIQFTSVPPITTNKMPVALASSRPASAEVTAKWVQFADGTTFGDASYAANLLGTRALIMQQLKRLWDVYSVSGPDQFAVILRRRTDTAADGYLDHLRDVLNKQGTQAAVDALGTHVETGESRAALLGGAN